MFTTTQSFYNTAGAASSNSYEWTLQPSEAGTLTVSENGLDCIVDWVTGFTGQVSLNARGLNDCGESDFSELLVVNVANTFGMEENKTGLGIAVYPNPSNGNLRVELTAGKSAKAKLKLFTSSGEPVWGPVAVEINQIMVVPVDVNNLSEGIYLLQVETSMGISNHKIVIKK
jgi:hypothetical protein